MRTYTNPLDALRHHVTGAVERGEAEPIVAVEPSFTIKFAADCTLDTIAHVGTFGLTGMVVDLEQPGEPTIRGEVDSVRIVEGVVYCYLRTDDAGLDWGYLLPETTVTVL